MATDLADESGAAVPALPEIGSSPARPRPFRHRFLLVYSGLAVALGAAAAGIVLAAGASFHTSKPWSAWRPTGGGLEAAREIAARVAPTYRLPGGRQLVDVITKAPSVSPGKQTIPIHYLAIRGAKGNVSPDQIFSISSSNSVMFSLCGLGSNCSIATGTPSVARGRLVRREILELALYTFKYVGGVQNVIAFMPPQPGASPQYLVYLTRQDLAAELKAPLVDSLSAKTPLPNTIGAREVRLVDNTTDPRVYSFSLSQAQQGDAILVLAHLPA